MFEGSSPSVKTKPVERTDPSSSTSDCPKARACPKSDFLCNNSGEPDTRKSPEIIMDSNEKSPCDEKTPPERYIIKSKERIEQRRSVIQQLLEKVHETEVKLERVKSDHREGNICRNCHLGLGYSARTCDYGKCFSVFLCRKEKFHPGELNIKEMCSQMKRHQSELNKLVEELDSKKSAIETMKDKVHNCIESGLFQANKTVYIVNGNKRWSLLHKTARKIPGKQDIKVF